METELKLLLDPASRSVIESHPLFAEAETNGEIRKEVTTYFDTPELELRRRGISLRVRRSGSGFIQAVKLDAPDGNIGVRGEWEWRVASASIDHAKLVSLPDAAASVRHVADRVQPIFVTKIKRKVWHLALDQATSVEAVLDEGKVQADDRQAPICEVELELKQGSRAPLFQLAIDLADRAGLRYGSQSKAERGYELLSDEFPPRPHASSLSLGRKATIADAFPSLVQAALRELAAEIRGAASRNVEAVHRMRAAIRKLRTLLVLFAPHLDEAAAQRFNGVLRDLGGVLGQGRDWDVFLTETLPEAEAHLDGAALNLLRPAAEARSAQAHAEVSEAMRASLLTGLILGLGAWTADAGWLRGTEPDEPLRDLLPHLLARLEKKVRKRAKHLDGLAAEDLHALRKSLKKLRYSVEDVQSLFKRKPVHRYLRSLKAVLSVLGEINDASVTVGRVGDVAPQERPELAPSAAALLKWNEHRRGEALRKLDGKLQKFLAEEPFWA